PTGATLLQCAGHVIDLQTANPSFEAVSIDGVPTTLTALTDTLQAKVAAGVSPQNMSPAIRALLALGALSQTNQWNYNVRVALAQPVGGESTPANALRFRINWCKVAVTSAIVLLIAAAATACLVCIGGSVISIGAFTIPCAGVCTGGICAVAVAISLLKGKC